MLDGEETAHFSKAENYSGAINPAQSGNEEKSHSLYFSSYQYYISEKTGRELPGHTVIDTEKPERADLSYMYLQADADIPHTEIRTGLSG